MNANFQSVFNRVKVSVSDNLDVYMETFSVLNPLIMVQEAYIGTVLLHHIFHLVGR